MLQTREPTATGSMRWRDVSCDGPDDFASLWCREASTDDLLTGDEVLCLPPVKPEQWLGPGGMSGYTDGLDGKGVARQKQASMGMVPRWAAAPYRGYTVVHGTVMRRESCIVGDADVENGKEDVARPKRGRPKKVNGRTSILTLHATEFV